LLLETDLPDVLGLEALEQVHLDSKAEALDVILGYADAVKVVSVYCCFELILRNLWSLLILWYVFAK